MKMREVKTEITDWSDDKLFGLDIEIIKDGELVAKLCNEEMDIKEELEDVPHNENDEVLQLTGSICEDQHSHSEFPEVKIEENFGILPGTNHSTVETENGESYNSNIPYIKRQSLDQQTSADDKYFPNKVTRANKKINYLCPICGYKCYPKSKLARHIRTHTGAKPYACDICSYKCIKKSDLTRHKLTHTGEKPYACNMCSYKCLEKSNLNKHMLRHTGEKPYACEICSYKCSRKPSLDLHNRIHTGEKPYTCDICNYKSSIKWNLVEHIRRHACKKPYACDICSDTYCYSKSNLAMHMRIHTSKIPYACDKCSYKCITKSKLDRHTKIHTGEKSCSNLTKHIRTRSHR